MNTVDELVDYCRELEPVGALMLSGEWGCGKTYLIEHDLKDALNTEAIVLRISLFGISAAEEIHFAVRNQWVDEYCKAKKIDKFSKHIKKVKNFLGKLPFLPELVQGISTTDISIFFHFGNQIDSKKVILVFDDLERCKMDSSDVLGIINDYCENQKFHTIIVANQERINSQQTWQQLNGTIELTENGKSTSKYAGTALIEFSTPPQKESAGLSYSEIKEKIIQRTITYLPDYKQLVHNTIDSLIFEDDSYRNFITNCEDGLLNLFTPDNCDFSNETNSTKESEGNYPPPPHNLRSLKCALTDFHRIYRLLQSSGIDNIENWLYSFTAYMIAYKADITGNDEHERIFGESDVQKLYPAFHSRYFLNCAREWVLHGIWNEQSVKNEIAHVLMRDRALSDEEIIKTHRIMEVDDVVLQRGFSAFLELAYCGKLTLDEYVLLIENSCWMRTNRCEYPQVIDWKKIESGIHMAIEGIKRISPEGQLLFTVISSDQKQHLSTEEWHAYTIISSFAFGDELMFHRNKMMYINLLKESGARAFLYVQNKRFNLFDEEMAAATADAFKRETNAGKRQMVSDFKNIWNRAISSPDIQVKGSKSGFEDLLSLLNTYLSECSGMPRTFSVVHTENFISAVGHLIEACKKPANKIES